MSEISAKKVVYTSFFVDLVDIVTNLTVALLTGSIVMTAETIQGFADLAAVGLLLIGLRTASRVADSQHPFGHGRDLYFWTLLASVLMLTITAGLSFYLGLERFAHPHTISNIYLAYVVLLLAIMTNGYAISLDVKRLAANLPAGHVFKHFFQSPFLETKTTFVLDLMGIGAAVSGLFSLLLLQLTGNSHFDGIGAMIMGMVIAIFSLMLIKEAKELLVGKAASRKIHQQIKDSVNEFSEVREIPSLKTVYMDSGKLLVLMDLHLQNEMTTDQIEKLILKIKEKIRADVPSAHEIQVEISR